MFDLPPLSNTHFEQVVAAISQRKRVSVSGENKRKWKVKIRKCVEAILAQNAVDFEQACRFRSHVSEECLRRLGLWKLVNDCVRKRRAAVPATAQQRQNATSFIQRSSSATRQRPTSAPPATDFGVDSSLAVEKMAWSSTERPTETVVERPSRVAQLKDLSRTVVAIQRKVRPGLAMWSVEHHISNAAMKDLMGFLNELLPGLDLPKAAATLLNVSNSMHVVYFRMVCTLEIFPTAACYSCLNVNHVSVDL